MKMSKPFITSYKGFLMFLPILVLVILPLVFLFIFSFMDSRFLHFPISEWTLEWYKTLFSNTRLLNSVFYSIFLSVITGTFATLMGFFSGYSFARKSNRNAFSLIMLMTLPAIVPYLIFGLGFLELARFVGIDRTGFSLIIAHIVIFSPLSMTYFYFQIKEMNQDIDNSAFELGASSFDVIFLHMGALKKEITACVIIIFALSWDEYIISWFLTGFQKTYAVHIRNLMESTFSPEIFAIGTLISFFLVFLGFIVIRLFGHKA